MLPLWPVFHDPKPLDILQQCLDDEFKKLHGNTYTYRDFQDVLGECTRAVSFVNSLRLDLKRLRGDRRVNSDLMAFLRILDDRVVAEYQRVEHPETRMSLCRILEATASVSARLKPPIPREASGKSSDAMPCLIVPTDLLYHARDLLLPAERMAVASGQKATGGFRLGAVFDVTGQAEMVHVQADPGKLSHALVNMAKAGCCLGAWIHSHPNYGPGATTPSSIDHAQHQDWLRHYPAWLLGIILVEDGWVRLFGTAVENQTITVLFEGEGITKENSHGDRIYRLTE